MRICFLIAFLFSISLPDLEATVVPEEIEFGGMQLKLTEGVRKLLQSDIDLIMKSPKGFQMKIDRANLYFPIIERVFKEEELPDDFKFLALQESSLVPDAVSTSNAVGYWQFKKESAMEVGLRVDHTVDERMNIVAASRGAARYLKKNNTTLNNWIYALLSYNLGLGGVKSRVEDKYIGARKMVIDKDMHWYVIRFLAHKIAYEKAVGKNYKPDLLLIIYDQCSNKSLRDISHETEVDIQNLELYNKWLLHGKIPEDKAYCVILPVTPLHKERLVARNMINDPSGPYVSQNNNQEKNEELREEKIKVRKERKKRDSELTGTGDVAILTSVNRIRAIKAKEGDTPAKLSIKGGIATEDFLRYNDMRSFEAVVPGKVYFLQPKRKRATIVFYTVKDGETLKDISQQFGIKIRSIRIKNRMGKDEALQAGRVLWLRDKRPKNSEVEIKKVEQESPHEAPVTEVITKTEKVQEPAYDKVIQPDEEYKETTVIPVHANHTENVFIDHVVKQGETFYGISRTYAVPVDSIKLWNKLADQGLKPGVKLAIKKNVRQDKEVKSTVIPVLKQEASPVTSSAVQEGTYHDVRAGETLYGISKVYSSSMDSIRSWNNLGDYGIKPGLRLLVKKKYNLSPERVVEHYVSQGETLYQISKKYNVKVEDLLKWNNKSEAGVSIGERIIIKKIQ